MCVCVCVVVDMILDVKRRKEWDSVFNQIDILEETDDYKIVYWWVFEVLCMCVCMCVCVSVHAYPSDLQVH